ncbi:tRNA -2'-O -methyltransferase TrmH [Xenorhabdus budapestensis]|uniref:tRNA-2'-O-methyltransferase TrmH n=1 Tax=Xenorhabdus budapestensis TaxID=290110 RepID=A0A2D0J254_XENBU|nr:tRNA -2'-O -methyltransferase TrmH [Xenorhabdus budapestensis]
MNPKRYACICQMMAMRQPDLTICLEEVHKLHNISAVIRSADAVGIHQIHAIWPTHQLRTQLWSRIVKGWNDHSLINKGKLSQVNLGG